MTTDRRVLRRGAGQPGHASAGATVPMKRVDDLDVAGRAVLLRVDFNVPLDGALITDDRRIRASLPTVTGLTARGARVIACAHLGRPKGRNYADRAADGPSLRPVAARLSELLARPVAFAEDVAGGSAAATAAGLAAGDVALLENVRFEPAETSKEDGEREALADRLAELADAYVGDGFGALHRKHASVYDLPRLLPHAAGQLVLAEISVLRQLTTDPPRPYVVVLGGAKPSDKLAVIGSLLGRADRLLIGGGMAYTFLAAQGQQVGDSLLETGQIPQVSAVLAEAARTGVEVVLPVDHVVADRLDRDARPEVVAGADIPPGKIALDIGPATQELFARKLADAKTVFWNGPPGVFEFPAFAAGTRAVAQAIANVTGLTVVGGGDSAAAVRQLGFPDDAFTHISTGGGASLEYLEGRALPGLTALEDQ
jgi:phosphoglycerate kinase